MEKELESTSLQILFLQNFFSQLQLFYIFDLAQEVKSCINNFSSYFVSPLGWSVLQLTLVCNIYCLHASAKTWKETHFLYLVYVKSIL